MFLPRPSGITQTIAEGTIRVMDYKGQAMPIKFTFDFPERPIASNPHMSGFYVGGVHLTISAISPYKRPCGGRLCDKQQRSSGKCACYQMQFRGGVACLELDVRLTLPDGTQYDVENFSSLRFVEEFMTGPLQNTPLSTFEDFDVINALDDTADNFTQHVNANGGWTTAGWTKQGTIVDQAAPESNDRMYGAQQRNEGSIVESGTLNINLVRLLPTNPMAINPATMNGFIVDLNNAMS